MQYHWTIKPLPPRECLDYGFCDEMEHAISMPHYCPDYKLDLLVTLMTYVAIGTLYFGPCRRERRRYGLHTETPWCRPSSGQ
ncbi:hypothetical protein CPB86DRAFT_137696 [Serendipita vermifera]|nr:hypothetical protein CPB86DRAFT_137696 [Serendipita vermifera]